MENYTLQERNALFDPSTRTIFHKNAAETVYSASEKAEMLNRIKEEEDKLKEIKTQKAEMIMRHNLKNRKTDESSLLDVSVNTVLDKKARAKEYAKSIKIQPKKVPKRKKSPSKKQLEKQKNADFELDKLPPTKEEPKQEEEEQTAKIRLLNQIAQKRQEYRFYHPSREQLHKFRKFKLIEKPPSPVESPEPSVLIPTPNPEKQRFNKAMRNMLIDKLGEKNVLLPNICSCSTLQQTLNKLMECRNVNLMTPLHQECANNCIYYKKPAEYQKALKDLVKSVTSLKTEIFL